MSVAFLAVGAALAQEKKAAPPPPKPTDDGPNLEVTMKFIQDKVNSVGLMKYVEYIHDNKTGADWTNSSIFEITKFVGDSSSCSISFHDSEKNLAIPGSPAQNDYVFHLKDVRDIVVTPLLESMNSGFASQFWTFTKDDPPVFLVYLIAPPRTGNWNWSDGAWHSGDKVFRPLSSRGSTLRFSDEQLANRVAKALQHAVELCGGGSEPEPF
jgi:hypothetical protein